MSKTLAGPGDKSYKYLIWDTAGQEKYHSLAPMYYRGAAAAIIVYDITKKSSFGKLKEWVKELTTMGPPNIVIAVAGNKSDLEDKREVDTEMAAKYANEIGAVFRETSAKVNSNVADIFNEITTRLPRDDGPGGSNAGRAGGPQGGQGKVNVNAQ